MTSKSQNKTRANRLGKALRRYGTDDEPETCLVDLLADARHWCDLHELFFADIDRRAYDHYINEISEQ